MEPLQRTPEHIRSSISLTKVENIIANWGWTKVIIDDYGEDLMLRIRAFESERPLGRFFQIQVKSMKYIDKFLLSDRVTISYPIKTKHLLSWLQIPEPVILVVYDSKTRKTYWTYVQEHILEKLYLENPSWKTQKTVKVPIDIGKTFTDQLSTPEALMSLKIYSIESLLKEGVIGIENGDDTRALKCFKQAVLLNPDFTTRHFIFTQFSKLKINNKISDSDFENSRSIISLLDDYAELLIAYANDRNKANFADRPNYSCPSTFTTFGAYLMCIRNLRILDKRLVKFDQFIADSIDNFLKKESKCFFIGNAHTHFLFDAGWYLFDSGQQQLAYQCFKQMFARLPELKEKMGEEELKCFVNQINNEIDTISIEHLKETFLKAQKDV
ncbi:DUF4365 domain-containing protein [Candidatus Pacearchaeota archaeon]|nr:DUF4365 domain-containing protein [Candidatus Pacearchaeota archaeon]